MDFLHQNRTCVFVRTPASCRLPKPLPCYPGFRAALEDICDRFGSFYAPFAAYNSRTRTISLFLPTDTLCPETRFLEGDTAIFNLEKARNSVSDPRRHLLLVLLAWESAPSLSQAMTTTSQYLLPTLALR
ncbi:hypothetical protein ONZ43_g714 [Nemania bipapillata]|uniref:Uncharacterized protein n=1 Tax=Nemania bipapillata TaxID=110536 RepID=A0ACC2J751_9PEZI|nr:hypothetical protein ONZ43_g714 [Nemania bipapillata]